MKDKHKRSIVKGISWRFLASVTTILLVFVFTGSLVIAAEVGLIEVIAKLTLYYLHERLWNRIHWGRHLPS